MCFLAAKFMTNRFRCLPNWVQCKIIPHQMASQKYQSDLLYKGPYVGSLEYNCIVKYNCTSTFASISITLHAEK